MRKKFLPVLALILALVTVIALAVPAFAHVAPLGANSNNLDIGIDRPLQVYHAGDIIHYTVTVSVPLHPAGGGVPSLQTAMSTYFTSPHDLVLPAASPQVHTVDFPEIPQLLPGESVSFTATTTTSTIYDPQGGDPTRALLVAGTAAMPASPTYITSTTIYPGGTSVLNSSFPALDYVINTADIAHNPTLIGFDRTENTGGSHDNPISNDSGAKEASISTFLSTPGTNVTITPSSGTVDAGQSVNLTVTETNNGNVALTAPVHVVVWKGVSNFADLDNTTATGDAGVAGVLEVGETWTWVISSGALNSSASFQATGHGIEQGTANDITYPNFPSEQASTNVTVNQPGTLAAISADPTILPVGGGTTTLTVTENNSGMIPLSNVVMTVTNTANATTYTLMKTGSTSPAVFVSGDTGSDSILGVGETWTWSIPNVPVSSDTTFIVNGDATYGTEPVTHVNFDTGFTTERNNVRVTLQPPPPPVPASTNLGLAILIAAMAGTIAFLGYRRSRRSQI